jgi:hypothetical protein
VLPFDEHLRYAGSKHGYHGGATPQEVLVPIAVLARRLPTGWHYISGLAAPTPHVLLPPAAGPSADTKAPSPQPSLFEGLAPAGASSSVKTWIDELLATTTVQAVIARPGRWPTPDRIARYLETIRLNGYSIPLPALATRVGEPIESVRGVLSTLGKLLNYDGAGVLTINGSDLAVLNRTLLAEQHGITVP